LARKNWGREGQVSNRDRNPNRQAWLIIFKGEPDTDHGFILQNTVVYPAPFVEWTYNNYFGIPNSIEGKTYILSGF
jgi:hypothetical protein